MKMHHGKRTTLLFSLLGAGSLLWFLMRVIAKPSRINYPCMRVAAPLASTFLIWIFGSSISLLFIRQARKYFRSARIFFASAALIAAGIVGAVFYSSPIRQAHAAAVSVIPNNPVGVAQGTNPGRVVWTHNADATNWAGVGDGHWWESTHTNQVAVDKMMSQTIRSLAGKTTDAEAWNEFFKYFNATHNRGNVGYTAGEKIMIKVNLVGCINSSGWGGVDLNYDLVSRVDYMNGSPQAMLALLRQLVNVAGIAQENISIGDPTCYFPNQFYNVLHGEFPNVKYLSVISSTIGLNGRTAVAPSTVPLYFSNRPTGFTQDYVPQPYVDATYLINLANFKSHSMAGITICAKNHFGSLGRLPAAAGYYDVHQTLPSMLPSMGQYRVLVDLLGHAQLGGKTMLNLVDGLYSGIHPDDTFPTRWAVPPFNNDWTSSLFASQDRVAIESFCFDLMQLEGDSRAYPQMAGTEDYLLEAAQTNNPPSGTFYDPDHATAVTRLPSLGVCEHWNNATSRKYSRNLNPATGTGIELVFVDVYNGPHDIKVGATLEAEDYDNGGEGVAYHDNDVTNSGGQYRPAEGVDVEVCGAGGYNVGWTNTGEWMNYTCNVTAGTYSVSLNVASPNAGSQIKLYQDGVVKATVTVPNTGGWQTWQTVTVSDVALTGKAGSVIKLEESVGGMNLDKVIFSSPQSAYNGPHTITDAAVLQVEDYDNGGEGIAYHDNDATNLGGQYRTTEGVDVQTCGAGGYNVGWTNTGEWLEYTCNVTAGTYNISLASANPNGVRQAKLYQDNVLKVTFNLPNTGGWQTWQNTTVNNVALTAGTASVLKLEVTIGDLNLDKLTFATGVIDPDLTDNLTGIITARGENLPNEGKDKAFDNNATGTKWLDLNATSWIQYQFNNGKRGKLSSYTITSGNDVAARDPKNWTLLGSNDGTIWTTLDTRTGETFATRLLKKSYTVSMSTGYNYFRLNITQNNGGTYIQLEEIELKGIETVVNTNVALNKTATQSTLDAGGVPSRAVDGNTSGVWANNSVTHTLSAAQSWWQVDLGASFIIDSIRVWNRTDCCSDRLTNFDVMLGLDGTTWPSITNYATQGGTPTKFFYNGYVARYVKVQLRGTNILSLAEVEVFGRAVGGLPKQAMGAMLTSPIASFGNRDVSEVKLFSLSGRLIVNVKTKVSFRSTGTPEFIVPGLNKGMYLYSIKTPAGQLVRGKLVMSK
jgi:hypothetical protein